MTARFLPDCPEWRYHSDDLSEDVPLLSNSIAGKMTNGTPRDAWAAHPKLGGKPSSPSYAMIEGSALHTYVLGVGAEVVELEHKDRRKKEAQEAYDAVLDAGKLPLLAGQVDKVKASAEVFRNELALHGIALDGHREAVIVWDELAETGDLVRCKARLDHVIVKGKRATIYDIKRGLATDPDTLSRRLDDYGYARQVAAYSSAVRAHFPEVEVVEWRWLCVDDVKMTVAQPDEDAVAFGVMQWEWAVSRWARCLREGRWPGHCEPGQVVTVGLKPWARKNWIEKVMGKQSDPEWLGEGAAE